MERTQFTVTFSDDTNFNSHIPLSAFDSDWNDSDNDTVTYVYYVDNKYADRFEETLENDSNVTTFTRTFLGAN